MARLPSSMLDLWVPARTPLPSLTPSGCLRGLLASRPQRERRGDRLEGGRGRRPAMLSSGATAFSPSLPPPRPSGAERARVYSDKRRVNGAPGRAGFQQEVTWAGALDAPRARSSLRPGPRAPHRESGRLPPPVLPPVSVFWAPEPGTGHSGCGSRRPGPRARRFLPPPPPYPGGSPAAAPPQPRRSLADPQLEASANRRRAPGSAAPRCPGARCG